eukprot:SAG11_NODE_734_length_7466_cov_3.388625_6_plen_250_part_00
MALLRMQERIHLKWYWWPQLVTKMACFPRCRSQRQIGHVSGSSCKAAAAGATSLIASDFASSLAFPEAFNGALRGPRLRDNGERVHARSINNPRWGDLCCAPHQADPSLSIFACCHLDQPHSAARRRRRRWWRLGACLTHAGLAADEAAACSRHLWAMVRADPHDAGRTDTCFQRKNWCYARCRAVPLPRCDVSGRNLAWAWACACMRGGREQGHLRKRTAIIRSPRADIPGVRSPGSSARRLAAAMLD